MDRRHVWLRPQHLLAGQGEHTCFFGHLDICFVIGPGQVIDRKVIDPVNGDRDARLTEKVFHVGEFQTETNVSECAVVAMVGL